MIMTLDIIMMLKGIPMMINGIIMMINDINDDKRWLMTIWLTG